MALTNIHIQNAKPRDAVYRLSDGDALWLEVRPTGMKIWRYRYKIASKGNIYTIGEFAQNKGPGHVSLEMARKLRNEARELVKKGIHPTHDRKGKLRDQIKENENTFKAIAEEWIARKEKNWTPGTAKQIKNVFKNDVYPALGKLPIRAVTPADVLKLINEVNDRGANSFALLIRQWVSAVYRFAIVTMRAEVDPAGSLNGAIERNKTKHSKSLSKEELKQLLTALHTYSGDPATIFGLELILLTFVRTIELRAARWEEINFAKSEWRIPADRMKMREIHIVPLSRQALAILKALYVLNGHREYLFPNKRDHRRYITATTLNRALERMGFLGEGSIGFSAHGFRSTASTMLNEAGFRGDVIERQLAHQERNQVRASYNHAQYMDERRIMMQVWADMIDEIGKNTPNTSLQFIKELTFQPA
ncbi:MAG: tyrosine-type recombinase/integrase [Alphaproteobacteria bacterium]|nr:tyrosine-type recombinase/integrase [Alphaproteobacteria bacterium]MDE2493095.1 tyrosine-type recombinase/integrase [Alphaproteobacteria bacterium]